MTPLRQRMIDAMLLHGFADRTQHSYLSAVTLLARHYHKPPDTLGPEQIQQYFLYLVKDKGLSASSCRSHLSALQFLYVKVLRCAWFETLNLVLPKKPQRIPELLSREEVRRILAACGNVKHHALLSTCYACGLRVSELVGLQLHHIDSHRHIVRIEQGKGNKDRQVLLTDRLLVVLRHYYKTCRPQSWLFFGFHRDKALSPSSAQKIYTDAKAAAQVKKAGGIHALRHAYATHQLEAGVPVHQLQHLLGHKDLHSTLRYVHWNPTLPQGVGVDLLVENPA
jgi:integrase/recombinase XerD